VTTSASGPTASSSSFRVSRSPILPVDSSTQSAPPRTKSNNDAGQKSLPYLRYHLRAHHTLSLITAKLITLRNRPQTHEV
jgi:hypothetical protein